MHYTILAKDSHGLIVFERLVVDDVDAEHFMRVWENDGFEVTCRPEFLEEQNDES